MSYEPPLRCQECGTHIEKKPKAKTPKYCPPCRHRVQEAYKESIKNDRTRRVRGR